MADLSPALGPAVSLPTAAVGVAVGSDRYVYEFSYYQPSIHRVASLPGAYEPKYCYYYVVLALPGEILQVWTSPDRLGSL